MAIYIREYEEGNDNLEGKEKWKQKFNFFFSFSYQDDVFFEIPSIHDEKSEVKKERKKKKRAEKLRKKIKLLNSQEVVLSYNLRKDEELCNRIDMVKNRVDGHRIRQYLACEMVEELMKRAHQKLEEQKIAILVNENSSVHKTIIKELAKKAKAITIVTNHINQFKKLEEELIEEWGIGITIANNKRKSLVKSEWILNLDFPKELVNQYQIFSKAVLINIEEMVEIERKSFEGITIQNCEISYSMTPEQKQIYQGFSPLCCYEAYKIEKGKLEEVFKELEEKKLHILYFFGKNGIVQDELLQSTKNSHEILDKSIILS